MLVNAQHVKAVPERKTDVGDAQWLAELLAHGLVRSSFVPPARIQELRDLTRTRKQLARELSQHTLRIQKVLEDANLKLASVLSSVVGKSGRAMLKAIVEGETNHPGLIDTLQVAMKEVDDSVGKTLDESAGKRRSTRLRKGGTWLKTTLVTCAWTAVRTKDSYLKAQFMRLKARRGAKKAIMAIAASMLTACFFMLRDEVPYKDLGARHFDRHDTGKTIGRLVKRLEALGCEVDIKRAA